MIMKYIFISIFMVFLCNCTDERMRDEAESEDKDTHSNKSIKVEFDELKWEIKVHNLINSSILVSRNLFHYSYASKKRDFESVFTSGISGRHDNYAVVSSGDYRIFKVNKEIESLEGDYQFKFYYWDDLSEAPREYELKFSYPQ